MGNACGLGVALEAATQLQRTLPDVLFLFVGEGAEKEQLVSLAQRQGLRNVRFLPQQPREKIPALIQASDLCLVLLKKADVFKTVIPTKMLEFMACGRPVILGVDGQAREILEKLEGASSLSLKTLRHSWGQSQIFTTMRGFAMFLAVTANVILPNTFPARGWQPFIPAFLKSLS